MKLKLVGLMALVAISPVNGQSSSKTLLTRRDAQIGAAAVVVTAAISYFDPKIAAFFSDTSLSHVRTGQELDGIFTHINETTLTAAGILAYGAGRLSRSNGLTDVAFHTTEAVVTASLASQIIRGPLGRSRPEVTGKKDQYDFHWFGGFGQFDYRAFPSIHSSSGFAAATALVQETRRRQPEAVKFVAPLLYAAALTPGLSRMYLGKHWASDIFAGAVMGTLAGSKSVNYSHAHPNRLDDAMIPKSGLSLKPISGGFEISWARRF